jgi:hypothetical protein
VQRVRITFAKGPAIRFIGHLDVVRMWERACRRERLPLAYTLGFTPHPRLTFAAPLAVGATGGRELVDAYFTRQLDLDGLRRRLAAQLPAGCAIVALHEVPLLDPPLPALTRWAEYRATTGVPLLDCGLPIWDFGFGDRGPAAATGAAGGEAPNPKSQIQNPISVPGSRWSRRVPDEAAVYGSTEAGGAGASGGPFAALEGRRWQHPWERRAPLLRPAELPPRAEIEARVAAVLGATRVARERLRDGKVTSFDLRPLVLDLWLAGAGHAPSAMGIGEPDAVESTVELGMLLRADGQAAGRPEDVIDCLGLRIRRLHRVRLGLEGDVPSRSPDP